MPNSADVTRDDLLNPEGLFHFFSVGCPVSVRWRGAVTWECRELGNSYTQTVKRWLGKGVGVANSFQDAHTHYLQ